VEGLYFIRTAKADVAVAYASRFEPSPVRTTQKEVVVKEGDGGDVAPSTNKPNLDHI